jgi:hypothetical protein
LKGGREKRREKKDEREAEMKEKTNEGEEQRGRRLTESKRGGLITKASTFPIPILVGKGARQIRCTAPPTQL